MNIIKPPRLKYGATIGVISPASPQRDEDRLERGVRYLEGQGFRVEIGERAKNRYAGYLAGTDEQRREDIENMFERKDVAAIFCARGGYGSSRLLNMLNYRLIAKNPKILTGFSDITALQSAIFCKTGLVTFSGAMVSADMADGFNPESETAFWQMLTEPVEYRVIEQSLPSRLLCGGYAAGRLLCGNLSMIVGLLGTPFAPDWKDAVLLVEDVGESPYRIDRNLMHLENAGLWKKLSGLCFGQFTLMENIQSSMTQRGANEVISEFASRASLPSLGNIMYGHTEKKLTLPFGATVCLNADKAEFKISESVVV